MWTLYNITSIWLVNLPLIYIAVEIFPQHQQIVSNSYTCGTGKKIWIWKLFSESPHRNGSCNSPEILHKINITISLINSSICFVTSSSGLESICIQEVNISIYIDELKISVRKISENNLRKHILPTVLGPSI